MASTGVGANIVAGAVNVGIGATQIVPGRTVRKSLHVTNAGPAAVFLGPANVTAATGFELRADTSIVFADLNGPLFAVAAALQVAPDNTRFIEVV